MAAIIVLGAVLTYAWLVWGGTTSSPQTQPATSVAPRTVNGVVEQVSIPAKGAPVRLMTMNACNYFVPEEVKRSNFTVKHKPIEAREALADLIVQSRAEIVGLSEMGGAAAVADLSARLKRRGVHFPHCVMVMRDGEERGLALLSRYPIVADCSVKNVPLDDPVSRGRAMMLRGILDATVRIPDGRMFRLLGVHLKSRVRRSELSTEEVRRREAYALREYLNGIMNAQQGMPILLYGDFNDGPGDYAVRIIGGAFQSPHRLTRIKPTDSRGESWTFHFKDDDVYYAFDLIFVNDVLKKRLGRKSKRVVIDSPVAQKAGDHRGIWLELL